MNYRHGVATRSVGILLALLFSTAALADQMACLDSVQNGDSFTEAHSSKVMFATPEEMSPITGLPEIELQEALLSNPVFTVGAGDE